MNKIAPQDVRQHLMLNQSRLREEVAQEMEDYWDATEEFSRDEPTADVTSIAASLSLSIAILSSKEYTVDYSATNDTERISTAPCARMTSTIRGFFISKRYREELHGQAQG